jgi:hypothetical protein
VIGGQAVLLYGEPRLTRDIDITLGVDTSELDRVLDAVGALKLSPLPQDLRGFVASTHVLPLLHSESGIRIDFVFSFSPYEKAALERVTKKRILKTDVSFASLEDLIVHKMVAGRPRDIEDVRGVLARSQARDDLYILQWLKEFGGVLNRPLLEEFKKLLKE